MSPTFSPTQPATSAPTTTATTPDPPLLIHSAEITEEIQKRIVYQINRFRRYTAKGKKKIVGEREIAAPKASNLKEIVSHTFHIISHPYLFKIILEMGR